MTKKINSKPVQWLSRTAQKHVRSDIQLRRAIEDHYSVTGYTTVNAWLTRRSPKLLNPAIIKLIEAYTGMEESEILVTYKPAEK